MSTTTAERTASREAGSRSNIYLAFIPWLLFGVISHRDSLQAAAVVALIAAIAVCVHSSSAGGRPKLLELATVGAFTAFTVAAYAVNPGDAHWLTDYARAIATALLALIAFVSLAITPFTEQYARETVPERYWHTAEFRDKNRHLTRMWALVFTAMVPSHILAGAIDTDRAETLFNWVVPVALVIWAAKRTERVTASSA
jgi:hypothetical protein